MRIIKHLHEKTRTGCACWGGLVRPDYSGSIWYESKVEVYTPHDLGDREAAEKVLAEFYVTQPAPGLMRWLLA